VKSIITDQFVLIALCRYYSRKSMFNKIVILTLSLLMVSVTAEADLCANTATTVSNSFIPAWNAVALNTGMGASGFSRFDHNDDGRSEFLFGTGSGFGSNTSYVIAQYEFSSKTYQLVCQSNKQNSIIVDISSFHNDIISAGSVIAYQDGSLEIIDHKLGQQSQKITLPNLQINDVLIDDIDNDGTLELAVLSADAINLFNVNSYVLEQTIPYGGKSFTSGYFSSLNTRQVATNTGYIIEVNDSLTTLVWNYSNPGFSNSYLDSGDIDGDGLDEIVAADSWNKVRAFNADTQGLQWEHTSAHDINALTVVDSDGDATPEVIYGDGQWGSVHILAGETGLVISSIKNPDHGVTDILVAELDGSEGLELIWGAGHSSTGADYLYIYT
jgi:hypothetical protein